MHNNYIIGLGGTGGDSVAAFRRATRMRAEEFKAIEEAGNRFQYLYIDSNVADIENAGEAKDDKWKVPGGDVHLKDNEYLCVDGNGMDMTSARNLPNIAPWLGNTAGVMQPGKTKIVGAGQRRRYGRMLLARRVSELNQRVAKGVDELLSGARYTNEITFHIFATLGGGTGSGSIVDMVTFLRKTFPNTAYQVSMYLYLYVGGIDLNVQENNAGFFFENEYSALKDLNALMCHRWKPEMAATPTGELYDGQDPIDAIFLSSEMSEVALPLPKQIDCMANACFDIVSLHHRTGGGPIHAFTGEDLLPTNPGEITDRSQWGVSPQVKPAPGKNPERSYRYATLGVSRMREPVVDIKSQLKSVFAEQIIDRWLKGAASNGARDARDKSAEKNSDIYNLQNPLANLPEQQTALSTSLKEYESEVLQKYDALTNPEEVDFEPGILRKLTQEVDRCIHQIKDTTSRDVTVSVGGMPIPVQQNCKAQAQAHYGAIVKALERKCTWGRVLEPGDTVWGINDTVEYLQNLITALQGRQPVKIDTSLGNMAKREKEWGKICGLTASVTNKQEAMYELHVQEGRALIERALQQRALALIAFMETQNLVDRLTVLKGQTIKRAGEFAKWKKEQSEEYSHHVKRAEAAGPEEVLLLDKERIQAHVNFWMTPDAENQLAKSLQTFEAKAPNGGPVYDFTRLNDSRAKEGVDTFWTESQRIHDELVKNRPDMYQTAYHANIYEALAASANHDENLETLSRKLKVLAGKAVNYRGGAGVLGADPSNPPKTAIFIGTPECQYLTEEDEPDLEKRTRRNDEMQTERESVLNSLHSSLGGQASPGKAHDFNHDDPHEIRIMKCMHWMPVRFFNIFAHVEGKYNQTMNRDDDNRINAYYYSNIDDRDRDKPELAPMAAGDSQHQCRLYYEMALRLPLPDCMRNGEQARVAMDAPENHVEVILTEEIRNVNRTPIFMPKTYTKAALENGDATMLQHLTEAVEAWMDRYGREQGDAVVARVHQEVDELNKKSEDEVSPQHIQMVYAVLNELESMVKRSKRMY